jgi:hypothetical protein
MEDDNPLWILRLGIIDVKGVSSSRNSTTSSELV